jgi:hypothetical protein
MPLFGNFQRSVLLALAGLIVNRFNRATGLVHDRDGHRADRHEGDRLLRAGLSKRAQAESTSYHEQKCMLHGISYSQKTAVLRCCLRSAGETVLASMMCLSTPDAELMEVLKHPVEIRNPQNQNDDHQAVQDRFDLSLHGDEPVHKPQQKPCCNKCDEDGGKWHIVFSNHFSGSVPQSIFEKLRAIVSLSVGAIRKRRTIPPLHSYSS